MSACTEGTNEAPEQVESVESALIQTFGGRVVTDTGAPIAGARVTVNGISRITNTSGAWAVSIPDAGNGYRIDVRRNGFAPVTEFRTEGRLGMVHRLSSGVALTVKQPTQSSPTNVRDESGIEVSVPFGSLSRTNGEEPAWPVNLFVFPQSRTTMPGDMTARRADGRIVSLITVGAATFQAIDSQGLPLTIRQGAALRVNLPVPQEVGGKFPECINAGECILRMWRFDFPSGLWLERRDAEFQRTSTSTIFFLRGPAGTIVLDDDLLGSWNADVEFDNPACMILKFIGIPPECFNMTVNFSQLNGTGGTVTGSSTVTSDPPFVVLYNLRAFNPVSLQFTFPGGAPAYCDANLFLGSNPAAVPNYAVPANGGSISVGAGAPWGGTGYPTVPGTSDPITLLDVAMDDHPCNSTVDIFTFQ